ncbi:hypothetical protein [Polaromonas sp. YR568]|uniref:hypothetical protein n=1 Tax=Polaromonas sp. YR568 TaxID=1855301 RepID=UPI00398BD33B
MKLLITALMVFVAVFGVFFFPFPSRYLAQGLLNIAGLQPYPGYVSTAWFCVQWVLSLAVGFGAACVVLRAMDVAPYASSLLAHRRWLTRGLIGTGAYCALVPITFVLSAIPYGGGRVPGWTLLVLIASWLLLGYGLFRTLFQELKTVKRAQT